MKLCNFGVVFFFLALFSAVGNAAKVLTCNNCSTNSMRAISEAEVIRNYQNIGTYNFVVVDTSQGIIREFTVERVPSGDDMPIFGGAEVIQASMEPLKSNQFAIEAEFKSALADIVNLKSGLNGIDLSEADFAYGSAVQVVGDRASAIGTIQNHLRILPSVQRLLHATKIKMAKASTSFEVAFGELLSASLSSSPDKIIIEVYFSDGTSWVLGFDFAINALTGEIMLNLKDVGYAPRFADGSSIPQNSVEAAWGGSYSSSQGNVGLIASYLNTLSGVSVSFGEPSGGRCEIVCSKETDQATVCESSC